jgi:flagellar basal-body rod modification protein FlgD
MTTINSNSVGSASATKATGAASLSSMSATDFLKIMTKQLANQDPQNPTSSTDLMQQLSTVYNLQANQEMMQNQGLTSAVLLIGSTVSGTDVSGNSVNGQVSGVVMGANGGGVNLVVQQTAGGKTTQSEVPLAHVSVVQGYTVPSGTTGTGSTS